jgi:hypothetical protein
MAIVKGESQTGDQHQQEKPAFLTTFPLTFVISSPSITSISISLMSIISPQPLSIPSSSSLRPLYEESSQFRHWRFSSQKLAKMRDDLNERSVKIVRENVEAEKVRLIHVKLPRRPAHTGLPSLRSYPLVSPSS